MDSERLSARTRQPGHDRTFLTSEGNFITVASQCLDGTEYIVEPTPKDLKDIFSEEGERALGVKPEAKIESQRTGKKFFVEIKKQGPSGNAEERAYKHHTVQFYKTMKAAYGYDYHPYVTVFCENLAEDPRYTRKYMYLCEPDQYFLWKGYDAEALCRYLRQRCAEWLV
jgi:hypothetical protein